MTSMSASEGAKLAQHLEATTGVCGGKPRIAGTRITVKDIALIHLKTGQTLAQIAGTYNLSMSALHEAMAYYYDHKEDIDRMIDEDEAFVDSLVAPGHPSTHGYTDPAYPIEGRPTGQ